MEARGQPSQTSQWKASLQKDRDFMENNKTIGGFSFNLDNVLTKFSQAVNNQQSESESRPLHSGYAGNTAISRPSAEGNDRTREQRLQAIKETAKHLQEKIQTEARKLKGEVDESKLCFSGCLVQPFIAILTHLLFLVNNLKRQKHRLSLSNEELGLC